MSDLQLIDVLIVALTALAAQIAGGLSGYGTGLIMPLVLVPLIGAEATVPVIGVSALITNPTRALTFRTDISWPMVRRIAPVAVPGVLLGAWGFTLLSGPAAQLFIGVMLLVLLPLRRILRRLRIAIGPRGQRVAGAGLGLAMGGTTGGGAILTSILMAAGLGGAAVVATDATISVVLGVFKTGVFAAAGALTGPLLILALLIGLMATPGALVARWLIRRLRPGQHEVLLEAAIATGAAMLLLRALTGPA